MTDLLRLEFPFPPPVSACFSNFTYRDKKSGRYTSRRVPTKRYEEWKEVADRMMMLQKRGKDKNANGILMPGKIDVTFRLVAPDRRERDSDNNGKALMDTLVRNGIITNDSNKYVRDLKFAWRDDGIACVCFIKPVGERAGT